MERVDKQKLHTEVVNILFSFEKPFTLEEVCKTLRKENVMTDKNKGMVIDIIDHLCEGGLIRSVPFTDQYVIKV